MKIVVFQVLTVGMLSLISVYEWVCFLLFGKTEEEQGEIVWNIISERIGTARKSMRNIFMNRKLLSEKIGLSEGCYFMGNRRRDEIYVDSSGPRIRLYVNVQKERVFLTVLKGHISIDSQVVYANRAARTELPDYSKIRIADIELQFMKRRVWQ